MDYALGEQMISLKDFEKVVSKNLLKKLKDNFEKFSILEYEKFYLIFKETNGLKNNIITPFIIQYFKKEETFLRVNEIIKLIIANPVCNFKFSINSKTEKITNLHYDLLFQKISNNNDFSENNCIVWEPFSFQFLEHSELLKKFRIEWNFLIITQCLATLNIYFPKKIYISNLFCKSSIYSLLWDFSSAIINKNPSQDELKSYYYESSSDFYKRVSSNEKEYDNERIRLSIKRENTLYEDVINNVDKKILTFNTEEFKRNPFVSEIKCQDEIIKNYIVENDILARDENNNLKNDFFSLIDTSSIIDLLYKDQSRENLKALSFVIQKSIKSISLKTKEISSIPTKEIQKFFLNIKEIKSSNKSLIFSVDFINNRIPIVVKNNYIRQFYEYFIGINLNHLRDIVPTFVYTLGNFQCGKLDLNFKDLEYLENSKKNKKSDKGYLCSDLKDKKDSEFICLEYIEGKTLNESFGEINLKQWLIIFCQILIGLEVAQEKLSFSHFDLHSNNIILKRVSKNYKVIICEEIYNVNGPEFIPVIIDFEISTIKNKFGRFARMNNLNNNFLIPSQDILKLLTTSIIFYEITNKKQLFEPIYKFYLEMFPNFSKTFNLNEIKTDPFKFKDIIYSQDASVTPKEFLDYLLKTQSSLIGNVFTVSKRTVLSVSKNSFYKIPVSKFVETEQNFDELIKIYKINNSLVETLYNYFVLEDLVKGLQISDNLTLHLKAFDKVRKSRESREKMIKSDEEMFKLFLNLNFSFMDNFPEICKNTLSKKMINLSSLDENSKLLISIKEQQVVIKFKCFMENFMNFYYKIIDLKLEGYFSNYIYLFLNSDKYKIYMDNLDLINKSSRWYSSLQENINPKTKLIK
jgi:sulfur transfer complex TusBCD TusB component (DsrH family)